MYSISYLQTNAISLQGETAEDQRSKEKSVSPQRSGKHESEKDSEAEEWESGDDTEGECWYPKNMEELVTVDEVGEDDSIIEPDLPELQEHEDGSASDLHKDPTEEEEEEEEELYDGEEYSYEYEVSNIPNYLIGTYY